MQRCAWRYRKRRALLTRTTARGTGLATEKAKVGSMTSRDRKHLETRGASVRRCETRVAEVHGRRFDGTPTRWMRDTVGDAFPLDRLRPAVAATAAATYVCAVAGRNEEEI